MTKTIEISSEVLTQEVGGETVILDLNSEGYFGLDEIGTRIWQLIQDHKDLQTTTSTMLDEYNVEEKQLEKDIQTLLAKLNDAGLISFISN